MLIRLAFISAERGAETSIMLASYPEYEKVNGRYFDQGNEVSAAGIALDVGTQEALWSESRSWALMRSRPVSETSKHPP